MEVNLRRRNVELQANIDKLNQRVEDLEAKFEEDKRVMMADIEERNARLTKQLNEFQVRARTRWTHSVVARTYLVAICCGRSGGTHDAAAAIAP